MSNHPYNKEEKRIVNYINENFSSIYAIHDKETPLIGQSEQIPLRLDVAIFRKGDEAEFENLIGAIELDGKQHCDSTNHKQIENDRRKNLYFNLNEIPLLRTDYYEGKLKMYEEIDEFIGLVIVNAF